MCGWDFEEAKLVTVGQYIWSDSSTTTVRELKITTVGLFELTDLPS